MPGIFSLDQSEIFCQRKSDSSNLLPLQCYITVNSDHQIIILEMCKMSEAMWVLSLYLWIEKNLPLLLQSQNKRFPATTNVARVIIIINIIATIFLLPPHTSPHSDI